MVLAIVSGFAYILGTLEQIVVSGAGEMLWKMVSSLWIGPETSLAILGKASVEAPHAQPPFAFLFAALVAFVSAVSPRLINEPVEAESPNRAKIGAVFLGRLGGMDLCICLDPDQLSSNPRDWTLNLDPRRRRFRPGVRDRRSGGLFAFFQPFRYQAAVTAIMAIVVGWLTLYSFRIQSGFADAWAQERRFWQQIFQLCPDITPKTRIFLSGKEGRQTVLFNELLG